jgi:uncharacterized OB-fold protein
VKSLAPDEGYDAFLDALASGDGYYLACTNGHGSLPPREVCPVCADAALTETPLPESGEVLTFTVLHVTTPDFDDDLPYLTAVVDFGTVNLTGLYRGVDPAAADLGDRVVVGVEERATTDERVVVFRPAD